MNILEDITDLEYDKWRTTEDKVMVWSERNRKGEGSLTAHRQLEEVLVGTISTIYRKVGSRCICLFKINEELSCR